jgi:hypothetical protein
VLSQCGGRLVLGLGAERLDVEPLMNGAVYCLYAQPSTCDANYLLSRLCTEKAAYVLSR